MQAAAKSAGHLAPQILKLALDVANNSDVARAAAMTDEAFGKLDIIVNNAGNAGVWTFIADSDPDVWWDTWEVNVKGVYLVTKHLLPLLLRSGEKSIVNVTSIGAHLTRPSASAYQTSKLAMLRLTQFTDVEYAKDGVIAYALNPGAVPTEMVLATLPPDSFHRLVDTPELSGDTITWLTQERREWLSGRYLSANWDMDEIMGRREEIVGGDKLKVKLSL
jgi:NAD(P)-dependent dehydrogenase (short-subunit alcohol dehydrogenase family)